jgi:hypothetical protein
MKLHGKKNKIEEVMENLKKYEKSNGWYFGKPNKHYIVNGIMKVFTGFDIVNTPPLLDNYKIELNSKMVTNIIDDILTIDDSFGGCGIYDYIYVLTRCMDDCSDEVRLQKCKRKLHGILNIILKHQQLDGGFKYEINSEAAHKYYNESIVPDGMIGNIHSTTLFCMALSRLDKYIDLGLDMCMAIS